MYRGINPTHASEGGFPTSAYGKAFTNAFALWWNGWNKRWTVLPHQNLMHPGLVGTVRNPVTIRPSLPYVKQNIEGPISIDAGQQYGKR